jgi:hypothetical protein
MQEPRDGDFVAYIEALQRESAARLAQHHVMVIDPTAVGRAAGYLFEEKPKAPAAPVLDQAVERFVRREADATLVKALAAGVAGAVFLLTWLGKGGPLSFIAAVALLAYAIPRLVGAFRGLAPRTADKVAIEQVFGRSGTQPGMKK